MYLTYGAQNFIITQLMDIAYIFLCFLGQVNNIGFITVHGPNEGHVAPYTDIEIQPRSNTEFITCAWAQ